MGVRRAKSIKENANCELVCTTDVVQEKSKMLANQFECDHYADYRDIIARDDVDCVIVSLPNKFHREASVSSLNSGKHVICEKPLARRPEEALEMVRAAKKNGRYLKVGSNLRYFPNVSRAKELMDGGVIGDLVFLRGWIGHSATKLGTWFLDPDLSGGGTYLDNGCHLLDLTRWFLGEFSECMGFVTTGCLPTAPVEDVGLGVFKTLKGKLAFIQSSWIEWADYMYMEVYGTEGFVRIDNRNPVCQLTLGRKGGLREVFDYSLLAAQSYNLELDDFVKAVRVGEQPLASGYDGMRAVHMACAVYESSKLGKKVDITAEPEERIS
jgi:predicted dehydrogenase